MKWIEGLLNKYPDIDEKFTGYIGYKSHTLFDKDVLGWIVHPRWNSKKLYYRTMTLKRMFSKREKELSKLQSEMVLINKELDLFSKVLKNVVDSPERKLSIVLRRQSRYTQGKVYWVGKWRYFHLGRTDKLSGESDDDLKMRVRELFLKKLESGGWEKRS